MIIISARIGIIIILDKLKKTFYKPNPEKILEIERVLEALSTKRRGGVVHNIDGKYSVLIDFGAPKLNK